MEGWTDVGRSMKICHADDDATESRIDFIFSHRWPMPALESSRVDTCDDFPTHKPIMVDIRLSKLKQTMKKLQPITDYAKLVVDMIQETIDEARAQADEEGQEIEPHKNM